MIELTPEAQRRLDKYLDEVKTYLQACPSVDGEDVRRDIIGHIEAELEGCDGPADADKLGAILERLGSPRQWVPEEEISWWRKILLRLRRGPEDWRLAYIAFGLLVLGVLLGWVFCDVRKFPIYESMKTDVWQYKSDGSLEQRDMRVRVRDKTRHEFNEEVFAFFVVLSFVAARASLAVTYGWEKLGAQRWLLYPPLLIVYLFITLLVFLWPIVIGGLADALPHTSSLYKSWMRITHAPEHSTRFVLLWILLIGCALSIWWMILGLVLTRWPGMVRKVFVPFGDNFGRRHSLAMFLVGAVMAVLCAASIALAVYFVPVEPTGFGPR
ncbi:MAG: hypothetical protein SVV80_04810 [Planctomycetota bacterium]|nr:hypothetical protein [Planctomycetota bacterium]